MVFVYRTLVEVILFFFTNIDGPLAVQLIKKEKNLDSSGGAEM